jgi:superfamily I DNA/RNA helicase
MAGLSQANRSIDFNDMIFLSATQDTIRPERYSWVFVDECQDLNSAQLACVLKCLAPGGRMLCVGDPWQSIYGFAGADADSFEKVARATDAKVFPLPISYRLPVSHVELVNQINPEIQAAPGAIAGEVKTVTTSHLRDNVMEGDLVLCRITKPLISLCFELISLGIPATIKGRDIGRTLTSLARRVSKVRGYKWSKFLECLDQHLERELDKLDEDDELAPQLLADKYGALKASFRYVDPRSLDQLCHGIEEIFSDTKGSICLSTVHRAKGLEASRVWVLEPGLMPHPLAKLPWQEKQELNLKLVAMSRSKESLFLVDDLAEKADS